MHIELSTNTFFVFDLDDTLFPEIDFLKSAYTYLARNIKSEDASALYNEMWRRYCAKENVFQWLVQTYSNEVKHLNIDWLLTEYRHHLPNIKLPEQTASFLQTLQTNNIPCGLITDGRSITQRNKLKALGIEKYFSDIIISEEFGSEKPDPRNYNYFKEKYGDKDFYFVGDNTSKDFIVPAALGWTTICIKNQGQHIHQQNFLKTPCPDLIINSFESLKIVIK